MLPTTQQATIKAKQLRQSMTPAEALLWAKVRNNQLGVKFRRQTPIGHYIADFYCHELKLIIELDGQQHQQQTEYDRIRTDYFQAQSITLMRFWNEALSSKFEAVMNEIVSKINALKSLTLTLSPRERE
jgi:very-short-patch-repair endonuclease